MSEAASSRGPDDWPDVHASLEGDSDAYARLIGRHQQAIGSYMWRFTRDRVQWEELVHDVFVEAYLSLRGYRGEAPLLHWLRKIATRVGYRWWKRRMRQKAETSLELQDWEQMAGADSGIDAAREAGQQVHALLAKMSVRDRLVLTLLYLEECSVAEAARLCGWSQTMVKVQAFRARKKLKKLLGQGPGKQ
jgi:RNA polymerase sigma-70 factor (ECF subfamily)